MALTKHFEQDHKELLEIANVIRSKITNDVGPKEISDLCSLLKKLTQKLKPHLQGEDKLIYPHLMKSKNIDIANMAKKFSQEMGDLSVVYTQYAQLYDSEFAIKTDFENFCIETKTIMDKLSKRIENEEFELYPAANRETNL